MHKKKNSVAKQRLLQLFDEGSFFELEPLKKSIEGEASEAVTGWGNVDGTTVYAFAQNPDASGGAMSVSQAEKITRLYDLAAKTGMPIIGIFDSKGGRLPEGNHMLDAFGKLLLASNQLSGVVPQISVIVGNCTGTSALIASSADIIIADKNASFGIETDGTAKNTDIPHLTADSTDEAISLASQILTYLPSNNLSTPQDWLEDTQEYTDTLKVPADCFDVGSVIVLSPQVCSEITTGFSRIDGNSVGFIIFDTPAIDSNSCAKAARHLRFCDAFSLPVISFVNAEKFTDLRSASQLAHAYAEATTVKLSVITGAAYGATYIAIAGKNANADLTLAWPSAVISPMEPISGSLLLLKDKLASQTDRDTILQEYKETIASPQKAAEDGTIDDIVEPEETREALIAALTAFAGKRISRLAKKHSNIQL